MAQTATVVNVRVEENIKRDVEQLFDRLGMNISTAVNMFFRQCLMEEGLPYHPKIKNKRRHIPLKERLDGFDGEYEFEEWDTGTAVGREIVE